MQIGIFPRTFQRKNLAEKLDAIVSHGLHSVQFDLADASLESLPDEIDEATISDIHNQMVQRAIKMPAISGTFNIIHPDPAQRDAGLRRLQVLAAACKQLGTGVITLCTGTRNTSSMWRAHPDNNTPEAWADLLRSMQQAVQIAEEHGVVLAFEPEVANVVDSARKARSLLDAMQSQHLKVVMDGANIFHKGELPRMKDILVEAFDLLGSDIALAHAKDLDRDGEAGHLAAGHGLLDYDLYLTLLNQSGYKGSIILHGLSEDQVGGCVTFLKSKLEGESIS